MSMAPVYNGGREVATGPLRRPEVGVPRWAEPGPPINENSIPGVDEAMDRDYFPAPLLAGGRMARVIRGSLTYRMKSGKRESAFAKAAMADAMARQERKAGNGGREVEVGSQRSAFKS